MSQDFSEFFSANKILLREYLDARLRLLRLQGVQLLSQSMSFFIWFIVAMFIVFFILLFLGILFALWIGKLADSVLIGFASAAGLFLILLLVLIYFRKPLFEGPVSKLIIRATTDDEDEEETRPV